MCSNFRTENARHPRDQKPAFSGPDLRQSQLTGHGSSVTCKMATAHNHTRSTCFREFRFRTIVLGCQYRTSRTTTQEAIPATQKRILRNMTHTCCIRPKRNGQMRLIRFGDGGCLQMQHPTRHFFTHIVSLFFRLPQPQANCRYRYHQAEVSCHAGEEAMRWMRLDLYLYLSIIRNNMHVWRVARQRGGGGSSLAGMAHVSPNSQTTVST